MLILKLITFFRFIKDYFINGEKQIDSFNLGSIPSVLRLYVVEICTEIFKNENYLTNFDGNIGDIILFDVLLDNLFFTEIRDEVTIYFYDFLKTHLVHYPGIKRNKMISFIKTNIINIDFDTTHDIFDYTFFQCVSMIIRSLKPMFKTSIDAWVTNKYLDKFCFKLIMLLYKIKKPQVKNYIIQCIILSNYYHLITYKIEWRKLPKTSEFMYLKMKYEFVEFLSHRPGIKYCSFAISNVKEELNGIREYITIDKLKVDPPKKRYRSIIFINWVFFIILHHQFFKIRRFGKIR